MQKIIFIISVLIASAFACYGQPTPAQIQAIQNNRIDKTIVVDSTLRNYIVHVPSKYTGQEPVPIVVMLHGTGGDGEKFWNISRWKEMAEKEGFIAVFPSALVYCYDDPNDGKRKRKSKWASEEVVRIACPGQDIKDDVEFLNAMLDSIEANYNIDSNRIYFSGFSNGGGFCRANVHTQMSDRVAAVATMGGLTPMEVKITGEVIPLWAMMGEVDSKIMPKHNNQPLPMTEADWVSDTIMMPLVKYLLSSMDMSDVYTVKEKPKHLSFRYTQMNDGSTNELIISIVRGLDHRYPNGKNNPGSVIAAQLFWDFFKRHHK